MYLWCTCQTPSKPLSEWACSSAREAVQLCADSRSLSIFLGRAPCPGSPVTTCTSSLPPVGPEWGTHFPTLEPRPAQEPPLLPAGVSKEPHWLLHKFHVSSKKHRWSGTFSEGWNRTFGHFSRSQFWIVLLIFHRISQTDKSVGLRLYCRIQPPYKNPRQKCQNYRESRPDILSCIAGDSSINDSVKFCSTSWLLGRGSNSHCRVCDV